MLKHSDVRNVLSTVVATFAFRLLLLLLLHVVAPPTFTHEGENRGAKYELIEAYSHVRHGMQQGVRK